MSINMDGPGDVEYADHEVQVLGQKATNSAEDQDNDGELDEITQFEPVSNRGIDSDELAELVAMYRVSALTMRDFTGLSTDEIGSVNVEGALGANLQDSELPTQITNNPTSEVNDEDFDLTLSTTNYSEPGVFDSYKFGGEPAFADVSNGIAGTGEQAGAQTQRWLNFRHEFGTGPFLDRTDDLTAQLEVEFSNFQTDALLDVETVYILYWNVEEQAGGRASFSRP